MLYVTAQIHIQTERNKCQTDQHYLRTRPQGLSNWELTSYVTFLNSERERKLLIASCQESSLKKSRFLGCFFHDPSRRDASCSNCNIVFKHAIREQVEALIWGLIWYCRRDRCKMDRSYCTAPIVRSTMPFAAITYFQKCTENARSGKTE
jgi:hypothetical protein